MDPAAITEMKAFLSQYFDDFQVIFYSRNPVDWVISFYQTEVRNGRTAPFSIDRDFRTRTDRELVSPWIETFGEDKVRVRFFARETLLNGDIVDDFFDLIGADTSGFSRGYHENKTLDQKSLEVLRLLNEVYLNFQKEAAEPRKALIRRLEAVAGGEKAKLSRDAAEHLFERRQQDLEWVSRLSGVSIDTIHKTSRICEGEGDMRSVKVSKDDALDLVMQILPGLIPKQ